MSKSPKKTADTRKKQSTPEIEEKSPTNNRQNEDIHELNLGEQERQYAQPPQADDEPEEVIPEDKDELIEFLKEKLYKTQTTIQEALGVLEEEKEMTGKLTANFAEQKKEFAKIQQEQNKSMRERVHEKVEKTLQRVISEKVDAEVKNVEMKNHISEKQMLKKELTHMLKVLQVENTEKEYELQELKDKVNDQDRLVDGLNNKKERMEDEIAEQGEQIKKLMKERDDTKGALMKLTDVKHVLNRLLSDPSALYMNNGEQPAREKEASSQPMQGQTGAKPSYLNNDEDFWYGDASKQQYAKDYGGKDKNYNQRYQHNAKMQNPQIGVDSPQSHDAHDRGTKGLSPANSMRTSKKKIY